MDLTSPRTIREIQEKFGFTFKKSLGQNFLTSRDVLQRIAEAAEIDNGNVIEIGPGFGVLTRELAQRAKKVAAIELDNRLLKVLEYTLSDFDNVCIINGDVLKINMAELIEKEFCGESVSVAANLPYYITTPIITSLIEKRLNVKNIVVMVQKEVAERMTAEPSSKEYGAITVLCKYFTKPSVVTVVPASLFVPSPKVDSAVLKLEMLEEPSVCVNDEKMFFRVVKAAFSQRRKTLLNCIASAFPIKKEKLAQILKENGVEPTRRGETLSLREFAAVADGIGDISE